MKPYSNKVKAVWSAQNARICFQQQSRTKEYLKEIRRAPEAPIFLYIELYDRTIHPFNKRSVQDVRALQYSQALGVMKLLLVLAHLALTASAFLDVLRPPLRARRVHILYMIAFG